MVDRLVGSRVEFIDTWINFDPCLVAIVGPPLHGKTTLGNELIKNSNLTLLDVDEARASIFPRRIVGQVLPVEQERFVMLTSYQYVHEQARDILQRRRPALIAGAYTREIYHEMLMDLAAKSCVPLKVILLECPEHEIQQRLQRRIDEDTLSNVKSFEHYLEIKNRYQRMTGPNVVVVNSGDPIHQLVNKTVDVLVEFKMVE